MLSVVKMKNFSAVYCRLFHNSRLWWSYL